MSNRKRWALAIVAVGWGCATNPAPDGWTSPREAMLWSPFGAWARVEHRVGSAVRAATGELIAVSADTVFVLARAGPGPLRADSADPEPADVEPARGYLWEIARSEIVGGTVVHYRPETGRIAGWAALGSLLTATHGWYLLITFPTWVITGTAAASAESYRPLEELGVGTGEGWTAVRRYARFPQGLPDTVDRAQLSPVIEPRR